MPRLLTPREVAEIMHISYESALRFLKYSGISYLKVGRSYRVSEANLQAFLEARGQRHLKLTD